MLQNRVSLLFDHGFEFGIMERQVMFTEIDFLENDILSWKKTYISLDDLEKLINTNNYNDTYSAVSALVEKGTIKPIKKTNGTNGLVPPLFVKYRICRPTEQDDSLNEEIMHLSGDLNISFYLSHPKKYQEQRDIIFPLSEFLKEHKELLGTRVSKNERAYQIWRYEKQLDSASVLSVLALNRLNNKLNYYNTPEPFFYFSPETILHREQTVLIIENKDTWYTLREIMREAAPIFIFGRKIDGILYGEGKKVNRPRALDEFCETELRHVCDFLYFGDLDFEGISIFQELKTGPPRHKIELFAELYSFLLDEYPLSVLSKTKKSQPRPEAMDCFMSYFTSGQAAAINELLNNGFYIPQEAVRRDMFAKIVKTGL